jgi:hypothetical protein
MVRVMSETPLYEAETTIMIEPSAQGGGTHTLENLVQMEAAANNSELTVEKDAIKRKATMLLMMMLAVSMTGGTGNERDRLRRRSKC